MKHWISVGSVVGIIIGVSAALATDYFTPSGVPATGAALSSSAIRGEFSNIGAGFNKIAPYTGHGSEFVTINAGATGQTSLAASDARTALGLGTMATQVSSAVSISGGTLTGITLVTPALGTPASGVATNLTGTASGLTAGTATTATGTNALYSATTTVNVAAGAAPTTGQVLTATGASAATWQSPGGMALAGSDLTERTTNTVGNDAATMSAVTGLSIPAGTPIRIMVRIRKTSGAAAGPTVGLKINSTLIVPSATGIIFTNNNTSEDGYLVIDMLSGSTNYQGSMVGNFQKNQNGAGNISFPLGTTNAIPIATITSITFTGDAKNIGITLATDQMRVYTYPIN